MQVTVKEFKDKFLRKPYIINLMEELTLKGITQVRWCGGRWMRSCVLGGCLRGAEWGISGACCALAGRCMA